MKVMLTASAGSCNTAAVQQRRILPSPAPVNTHVHSDDAPAAAGVGVTPDGERLACCHHSRTAACGQRY